MNDFLQELSQNILQTSSEEWIAFATSLIYVWLASRQHIACWFFGIVSSAIYVHLCFKAQLYAETMLQCFYVLIAFWGWIKWNNGKQQLKIEVWNLRKNLIYIGLIVPPVIILGFFLDQFTDQALPYLDAALFCYSIFATYLIALKVLQNWLYFIVIDLAAFPLYLNRMYYLTALLYLAYALIAAEGYRKWRSEFKLQQA